MSDADSAESMLVSIETLVINLCQFAAQVLISIYTLLNGLEASCLVFLVQGRYCVIANAFVFQDLICVKVFCPLSASPN